MRRRIFLFVTAALLAVLCCIGICATEASSVVYLDGTGATTGAYTDLKSAVSALPNGGTVVVTGDTLIGAYATDTEESKAVTLSAVSGKVTITSKEGDTDHGATLTLARSLTLASELEFNNITFCNASSSNGRILTNSNKLTIGEGVTTTTTVDLYPTIFGGGASGGSAGHIVIQSGTWDSVFGGAYGGTFKGNSLVEFTGGTILKALVGGNRNGGFVGNATLNIGGDAVVEYAAAGGVIGGTLGISTANTTAYTFTGDITINISGNASIAGNVLGASRYSNITTKGDITVNVGGNAKLTRNLYAGGYFGGVTTNENGIRVIVKENATIGTNRYVCAGSLEAGTVTGNGYVEFRDNAKLTGALYAGGYSGSFTGNTAVAMYGGTVTSTVSAASRSGTVSGTQSVTLYGGKAGPVKGDVTIDLAADASVTMASCSGTVTTVVPTGYEVAVDGTTYTAVPAAVSGTVYVDGTGATAGAYTDLASALSVLNGGTVIVSGNTTVSEALTIAEMEKDLTICAENGAVLTLSANITLAKHTNGAAVIFDLPVAAAEAKIFGGFGNVTFGENFTVDGTLDFYGGVDATSITANVDAITETAYSVTVKNGTFRHFAAGNLRSEYNDTVGSVAAPLTVTVSGGTFTDSFSLSGMSILADNATLDISGGTFHCPVYVQGGMDAVIASGVKISDTVASDAKYYAIDGDITVLIRGGIFNSGLISAYEAQVAYTQVMRGNYTVTVRDGTFADGTVFDATQVKAYADASETASLTYPETYIFTAKCFDTVNGVAQEVKEPLRIAFVGDSITEGYTVSAENADRLTDSYPAQFAALATNERELIVSNYGISSAGILQSTSYYYPDYLAYPMLLEETDADYIVIALGTNDNYAGGTTGTQMEFEESYGELIETVGALPETDKVFITNALVRDNEGLGQIRVASVVRPIQERIAKAFAAKDSEKYVFVDLYRLTMPQAAADTLLSSDDLHPGKVGYAAMADVLYGVIFGGESATTDAYKSNDIYVSASGSPFGSGTKDDTVSRLDIAFAMLPEGEEATIHIKGKVTYSNSLFIPITPAKLTIVGEESGAILENGGASFKIGCDVKFDNLTLSTTTATEIFGCYNDIEMTNTVTLGGDWSFFAGHNIYREGAAYAAHDTVESASDADDCHITLNCAGMFTNFAFGNRRCQGLAPFGTYSGDLTAYIGENVRISGTDYVGIVGQNYLTGTIAVEMPTKLTLDTYAPTHTVTSPIVYDPANNTGSVTVATYEPTPAVTLVYVDGSGETEGAYTDLASAALALREGGTIVVCGTTAVDSAITLSAGGELLITSVYGDEDYTDTAALQIANDITLGTATTFKDIILDKAAAGNDYIVAKGNALVIDENVYCRNTLATNYITIVGGAMSGTFEGDSNITVKSGYFRNIYGGNYNGTFKGNSNITFIGGYVDNMIAGGTFMGNFEGDSHVNIGGDAVVVYTSAGSGVNGACCGSGNTAYTFVGDIYINLYGSARVNQSVYGTARYSNVTTTGNVYITIKDDAFVYLNLYAGGYGGTLNGNTEVMMDSGWVGANLTAGSRSGTVNGDTYLEINGGKVNYYATNIHSSVSDVAGEYNVAGGGLTGAVNGNTAVVISGGDIYGNVYGGGITTGTVSGNSTVTLTGGSIWCGAYADGATADSVSGTKTLDIDLSEGGSLALGLSADVNTFTGGGSLTLFPEATITADSFSGAVALAINGVPQARAYITATEVTNASVTYAAQDDEVFVETVGESATEYGISSTGYYATTKVTFKHYSGVQIYMRAGLVTTGDRMTETSAESEQSVFDLAPGLYNYVVYHTQEDYKRKYIYITGKEETLTLDLTSYTPMVGEGFEAAHFYENTEEIYDTFYNTEDLIGYAEPDSPYFTNDRYGKRLFTSNAELVEFVNTKVASCDYAYAYDLFTSPAGNTMPLVLFTKDDIPADATLEEAAKIISATKGRDIMMVTAIVHGNEPSAGEGALALISDLCGEYGDTLLTGNVGAVIIIPRLNPDGCDTFTRETPTAVGEGNLNRDYALLTSAEISGVVHAFDIFEPTILIDCHEAGLQPKFGDSNTLTDIYDVGIMGAGTLNTPFVDATAAIKGDYANRGMRMAELLTDTLEGIEETGLRAYYYQTPMTFPANNSPYGLTNGAYTFLIEVPGILGGDAVFARRVFAHVTAMKEIFALAAESDGQLAREVNDAREKVTLSAQKFDVDTPIVLQHNYTRHDTATMLWNNPLVGADATLRRAENITKYYLQDIAIKYRSRPTAYVVSADASGIAEVLRVLDIQGIGYALLDAGTTLTLKQYSGSATAATLGAAAEVTFANGAYIIPVDGYKAYLISTLFEPENPDSGEYITTFVQKGHLAASDIYRSEENYIAAKLGIDGTYAELAMPAGKTLDSATVDGVAYTNVDVLDGNAYVVASDSESYTATLYFTDGTSETYTLGKVFGDISGNGSVGIEDALAVLQAYLNGTADNAMDVTGDGKTSLLDVLRILKMIVA